MAKTPAPKPLKRRSPRRASAECPRCKACYGRCLRTTCSPPNMIRSRVCGACGHVFQTWESTGIPATALPIAAIVTHSRIFLEAVKGHPPLAADAIQFAHEVIRSTSAATSAG